MSGDEGLIKSTTTADIKRFEELVVGNSVRNLRIVTKRINRRLVMWNRRLIELRSNESIIKARINNNVDLIKTLENRAGSGMKVKPQQSYDTEHIAPDTNHAVHYDIHNITKLKEGVKGNDRELNRINTEIKVILAQIRKYEEEQKKIETSLTDAEEREDSKENLIDKTIGRVLPPTAEDLKQDEISRAEIANVMLLYQLCFYYYELSYDPEKKERKYGDEQKLPQNLLMIRQIFWSHAQVYPEFIEEDSIDKLNFNDPGDLFNQYILKRATEALRYTAKNSKTSQDVDRYMKDLKNITNDASLSRGIERKPDPSLPASDSMSAQTSSYPASMIRLGDFYLGSFELPTFSKCLNKWWKRENEQLYFNLPVCPRKTTEFATSTDGKMTEAEAKQEALAEQGASLFKAKLEEAKAALKDQEDIKIGDLPDDAPEWVKDYTRIYGETAKNILSFKELQLIVTRGEGKTQIVEKDLVEGKSFEESIVHESAKNDAERNAKKIFPVGSFQVKSYVYFSQDGYIVTYKKGSEQFIPLINWSAFQQDKVKANSVKSQRIAGTYVYYFLWATKEQADALTGL